MKKKLNMEQPVPRAPDLGGVKVEPPIEMLPSRVGEAHVRLVINPANAVPPGNNDDDAQLRARRFAPRHLQMMALGKSSVFGSN